MYELVADAESYPAFLPWCRSINILSREDDEVVGTVELVKGPVHKSFTTVNRLVKGDRIDMELVEGPFKHLHGVWRFQPIGDQGCRVSLDLEFEFSNRLLGMSFGPLFGQMAGSLVDAFTQRANSVYG